MPIRFTFPLLVSILLLSDTPQTEAWAAQSEPADPGKAAADDPSPAGPAAEPGGQKRPPLVKFLTVRSPIEDVMSSRVKNLALELDHQATRENRRAMLVLEITPGTSEFHHVQGLAKFLISTKLSKVTTVAWVPETVTGNNVVLTLACNEIIMHPDAELGDLGRGQPLDHADEQAVLHLVDNRHNVKVNRALVSGMMDPQIVVLKIKLETREGNRAATESRVVTPDELRRLQENKTAILDVQTIKEAGETGLYTGSRARALDVLAVQTAESRGDVADLYGLAPEALREDATAGEAPRARLIKVDGMIEPILETFLERQIQRAVASKANLIVFEIDSPGGLLLSSTNLAHAIADLDPERVRSVAYIPETALSGAAIIALGCDEIYMHPEAQIGDAGPIEMREGGQFEHAPEKVLSHLRETLRILAEKKGRPPALAEAMADRTLEVFQVTHRETGRISYMTDDEIHASNGEWTKGRAIPESKENLLLTVNGQRAHELGLAEPPVADREALKQRLAIPADVELVPAERTWVDTLVFLLNHPVATFLLFLAGAAFIYLELHTMTGLFGILSALCFSLFFWSRFLGGTAGWLEVVLFVLGLICIALEIFVIPGFGVFGVSGGLLLLASLVLASQTFGNLEPGVDFDRMARTMGTLSTSILSVIVLAVIMSRFLPQTPILKQAILMPPGGSDTDDPEEPHLRPEYANQRAHLSTDQDPALVGQQGVAVSVLRPAGKVQIGDRYLDVISDGPFIERGRSVEVIDVNGNVVIVREV